MSYRMCSFPCLFICFVFQDDQLLQQIISFYAICFEACTDDIIHKQIVKLKGFSKFENTADGLASANLLIKSETSKPLGKFLHAHCEGETLAVADSKLGNEIKEKLVSCCPFRLNYGAVNFLDYIQC